MRTRIGPTTTHGSVSRPLKTMVATLESATTYRRYPAAAELAASVRAWAVHISVDPPPSSRLVRPTPPTNGLGIEL